MRERERDVSLVLPANFLTRSAPTTSSAVVVVVDHPSDREGSEAARQTTCRNNVLSRSSERRYPEKSDLRVSPRIGGTHNATRASDFISANRQFTLRTASVRNVLFFGQFETFKSVRENAFSHIRCGQFETLFYTRAFSNQFNTTRVSYNHYRLDKWPFAVSLFQVSLLSVVLHRCRTVRRTATFVVLIFVHSSTLNMKPFVTNTMTGNTRSFTSITYYAPKSESSL